MAEAASNTDSEIAREMRLRASPAPVMRLSRKALTILGAASILAIVGAVGWGLMQTPHGKAKAELYTTEGQKPPEALAALPQDYGGAPKLGQPLPGDLGRPMLAAGQAGTAPTIGGPVTPFASSPTPADPAQQRSVQAQDAARTSRLFTAETSAGASGVGAEAASVAPEADQALVSAGDAPTAPVLSAGQAGKLAFLKQPVDKRTTSAERLQAPVSPYVIQAGAVIPAALITGLRSDLPSQITAQVTENVYDSPTGRYLLIPQGARLVGQYDSQVAFGQSRVLLAWTRLILPGGKSIVLERQPGADAQGFAGLQDRTDHHWGTLFDAALLSTVLGVGTQAGASDSDSQIVQALRQGAANSLNQTGQQVVAKSLDIQPTLTVRPGFPVRVIVTRDLVLEPYKD